MSLATWAPRRARLLDRARAEQSEFQGLLTRYALERLLFRLSASAHREQFILTGAMLFAAWMANPFRPTRDLDLLGTGADDVAAIARTFRDICTVSVPDNGVSFDAEALRAEAIRENVAYGGVRERTTASIAGAKIPIQVDIGFGDVITPAPVEIDYPTMLGNPPPRLQAYPVETVVAEALIVLGIGNTRLKDYYDLWLIAQTFAFRHSQLAEAVQRTLERRSTAMPLELPPGLSKEFATLRKMQWRAFLGRERMAVAPAASNRLLLICKRF
jgi:predicted nucleotidyltransferase component of viral defense system